MTEKKTNVITVNEKEYNIDAMTDEQKLLLSHVQDLERKIGNTQFNMDQLRMGREAVLHRFIAALEAPKPKKEDSILFDTSPLPTVNDKVPGVAN